MHYILNALDNFCTLPCLLPCNECKKQADEANILPGWVSETRNYTACLNMIQVRDLTSQANKQQVLYNKVIPLSRIMLLYG